MSKKYRRKRNGEGRLCLAFEAGEGSLCYKVLVVGRDPNKTFKTEAKSPLGQR